MNIFIDESGTFTLPVGDGHSISAVGSLVIPSHSMKGFERLYGRLRSELPKHKGEVKGRLLSEDQVVAVANLLRKIGGIFEVVAIDMGLHSEEQIKEHKLGQAQKFTANLTPEHHPNAVRRIRELRDQLENMPLQLYAQSIAMEELVYHTLNHANLYHSLRTASELREYYWVIDAKDPLKTTPWEEWWSIVILPMLEAHTFREPFISVEGGDYRWHDQFRIDPSAYKRQFVKNKDSGDFFDLRPLMTEHLRFSSLPEFGLEAVDILTNTIRRSMSGNFGRAGWLTLRQLMIHHKDHYVRLICIADEIKEKTGLPYSGMINDFRSGGRLILPPSFRDS